MISLQKSILVVLMSSTALAVLSCAQAYAAGSADSPLTHDINSIVKLLDESKLDLALRKCNAVLKQDHSNVGALALRSTVYSLKNDRGMASADEKQALTLLCRTAFDELMVSKLFSDRRRFENALTHINKAIQLDPNDARFYCQRSNLDILAKDNKKAVDDLNKALQIDPHCSEAFVARFRLHRVMHNPDLALADLDQAIKYSPTANNYTERAIAYTHLNRFSDAVKDYDMVISLAPAPLAYSGRAASYLNLGQPDKAWPDLDKAIAMAPDWNSPRKLKAQAFLSTKQPAKALAELAKLKRLKIFLNPQDDLEIQQVRYKAHEQMGDWTTAVDDLENIVREFPSERWAVASLRQAKTMVASTGTQQKKPQQPSEKLLSSENDLKTHDAETHIKLSRAACNLTKYNEAIKEANIAITLDPLNCSGYVERGWAYYQSHQTEKAKADFENAALMDNKNPEPFECLGRLYRSEKDYQLALKNYSKAIPLTIYEDDYIARSEINLLAGKSKESLEDAGQALKRNPRSVPAMVARANANIALNQPAKAVPDLNFAIQLHPDKEEYLLLRIKAYQQLGQTTLAAKDLKTIEEQKKDFFENAPFRTKK